MFNPKNISILATLLILIGFVGSLVTYRSIPKQEIMTEEIGKTNFKNVEIVANNGEVSIEQTNEPNPYIEISGYNLKKNFSNKIINDTLLITYEELTKRFFNFGIGQKMIQIQVYLPKENYETVIAEANNGKIYLSNITAKELNVKTNNGSVNLNNSHANQLEVNAKNGKIIVDQLTGETIQLEADNGRLEIKDVLADTVNAVSKNGKIELTEVSGTINAKSDNGKIHLVNKKLEAAMDLVSKNGKVHIETTEEPKNVDISAQAKNGSITLFNEKVSHKTFGAGENKIHLQSHNGKIIVEKSN